MVEGSQMRDEVHRYVGSKMVVETGGSRRGRQKAEERRATPF